MKKFLLLVGVSCIISIISIFVYINKYDFFSIYDNQAVDAMFKVRGEQTPSPLVAIVDIDDKSLNELGQWPWSRHKIAKIVDNLVASGVGIIGFDIVFASRDNSSPKKIIEDLDIDVSYLEQMMKSSFNKKVEILDYDEVLATSLKKAPAILGYIFSFDSVFTKGEKTPQTQAIVVQRGLAKTGGISYAFKAKDIILNTPIIQDSAYSSGFF